MATEVSDFSSSLKKDSLKNKRNPKQNTTEKNWFKPPKSNLDLIQKSKNTKKVLINEKNSFSKKNL